MVVSNWSMAAGDAGVHNPLFFHENRMLLDDAKQLVDGIVGAMCAGAVDEDVASRPPAATMGLKRHPRR